MINDLLSSGHPEKFNFPKHTDAILKVAMGGCAIHRNYAHHNESKSPSNYLVPASSHHFIPRHF
jgi:hypothetical protein